MSWLGLQNSLLSLLSDLAATSACNTAGQSSPVHKQHSIYIVHITDSLDQHKIKYLHCTADLHTSSLAK